MKRLLLLSICLFLSVVSFAHDIEIKDSKGVTFFYNWINNNTELEVTFKGDNAWDYSITPYSGALSIPSTATYNGSTYPVTAIGDYAFVTSSITSVVIPNGITRIGIAAFSGNKISEVFIPASVTNIVGNPFNGLANIIVSDANAVYDSRESCNAIIETATNKLICGSNTSVIPNSIETIGDAAFSGCKELTEIEIPASVRSIGERVFTSCTSLKTMIVDTGNQYYDSRNNCNAIVRTTDNTLIAGCGKTIIPTNVGAIGNDAFSGHSEIGDMIIPNSVKSIMSYAFFGCSSLKEITIPDSVTFISNNAFAWCDNLKNITIGKSVKEIGDCAFQIGWDISLPKVKCLAEFPPICHQYTFNGVDLSNSTLFVPAGSLHAYKNSYIWKDFGNIAEIENLPIVYTTVNNGDDLAAIVENAPAGSIIKINPGTYLADKKRLPISKEITIQGLIGEDGSYPVINANIILLNTSSFTLKSVKLDGTGTNTLDGAVCVKAGEYSRILLEDVEFVNNNVLRLGLSNTLVKNVSINNCKIHNFGQLIYCVNGWIKDLYVTNSTIYESSGDLMWMKDNSTVYGCGSNIVVDHCTLYNIDKEATHQLFNIRYADKTIQFTNNIVVKTKCQYGFSYNSQTTEPVFNNNYYYDSESFIHQYSDKITFFDSNCNIEDPQFADAENGDFTPKNPSFKFVYNAGDPRWIKKPERPDDAVLEINKENFPDETLLKYLVNNVAGAEDGYFTQAELDEVKELELYYVSDVTGLEYFSNLESLNMTTKGIKSLDFSEFPALKKLILSGYYKSINGTYNEYRDLQSLNVSNNSALEQLYVMITSISQLDVTHNPKLRELRFMRSNIEHIDLSQNPDLRMLDCRDNKLTELDLTNNLQLEDLRCGANYFTSLDISKNTALTSLSVTNQTTNTYERGECPLTSLDVSKNTALIYLDCSDNDLTSLDVSMLSELESLYCGANKLTNIDVSNNPKLTSLSCGGNNLGTLDITKNTELITLNCVKANLKDLDVSKNTKLTTLYYDENDLHNVDLTNNKEIVTLGCSQNNIETLSLSGLPKLKWLYCNDNLLKTLDTSNNPELKYLQLGGNLLMALDLSKNVYNAALINDKGLQEFEVNLVTLEDHGLGIELREDVIADRITDLTLDGKELTKNIVTVGDISYLIVSEDASQLAELNGKVVSYNYDTTIRNRPMPVNLTLNDGSIQPIEEETTVSFSDELKEVEDLGNTIVNDIYYNLSESNNDGYNSDEECIVLNSSMTSTDMEGITEQDITSSVVAENFSGIIFKVEGKGEIDVDCQTIGNKTLNIQIGTNTPTVTTKSERGTIKVNYDVTEPTLVYVYGSVGSSSAKGIMRANASASDNAIKIWSLTIIPNNDASGINIIEVTDESYPHTVNDVHTLSGVKVPNGSPNLRKLPRGIYIVDGKKVIVK